jgi:hypothetical protein
MDLKITVAEEYFQSIGKPLSDEDYDNEEKYKEIKSIGEIVALEVAIHLCRRTVGVCGSVIDNLSNIRSLLIENHNEDFDNYEDNQDFY